MSSDLERSRSGSPSVVKKAVAGIVLVVVAALVLKALIGFVIAIFWVAVIVAVIAAVLWALKTIIWQTALPAMYGVAYVVIALAFGLAGGFVGRMKGSSFWMWFLVSFCVPFIGLACAVLYRWDDRELRRQCPSCGKVVKLYDAVCVRCGEELEFPDVAIASEAAVRGNVPRPAR